MARSKALPARKVQARDEESLLLRSAESLGRMIGRLQRQLDEVASRLSMSDSASMKRSRPKFHPASANGASRAAGKSGNGKAASNRSLDKSTSRSTTPKKKTADRPSASLPKARTGTQKKSVPVR